MLLSLIRISIRNVTRNSRRSFITAFAVLIGTLFIIFSRGVLNGFHANIVSGFTETQAGDLQMHRPDYLEANEALPLDKSFEIDDSFRKMMAEVPEIQAYTGRVLFSGMISAGEDTTLFIGVGVDPENEYNVCPRNKENILAGGGPIVKDKPKGVVIGKALADSLHATVGSELTLLVNTSKGGLNAMDVTVSGIADIQLPGIGNKLVHVPLETAQQLLYMDKQVTEVIMNVRNLEDVTPVENRLNSLLAGSYKSLNLVPNTWMDVGQIFVQAIELQNSVLQYIVAVLFIVMIAGIVNTMLMSVFERVREVGTMMALGVRRRKILMMFMMESVTLGSLGAVMGVGLGWLTVQLFRLVGFPIPSLTGGEWAKVYPYIRLDYMLMVIGVALVTAVLAAMYPAVRASRMQPAEALRTL